MRTVRVFLATPLGDEELNRDRVELDSYLGSLTENPRVRYQTYRWEYESGAVNLGGTKQEAYNRLVEKSDLLILLCSRRLGPGTEAEYEAAKESQRFRGYPQILTCFRGGPGDVREASGESFHAKVKADGHYPQYYADFGALERLVSRELQRQKLHQVCPPEKEPMAEDGRTVEILRRIPAIENDATFHDLLKNYKEFWKQEQAAWAGAGDDLNDTDYLTARILTENARKLLKNRIGLVLAYAPREDVPNLSDYEREANELINKGDLPGANAAFSMERIQAEAQAAAEDVQRKYLRKVDLLRGLEGNHGAEIRAVLETAVQYERGNGLPPQAMRVYLDFLWKQHEYTTAIPLARKHLQEVQKVGKPWEIGYAANMVGMLCAENGEDTASASAYLLAKKIYGKLMTEQPQRFRTDFATACNNLGILYKKNGRLQAAEECYREAKSIREALVSTEPEKYMQHLASTCNNLGILYCELERYETSEQEHLRAKGIREKLAESKLCEFLSDLADSCDGLGNLYSNTDRMELAEAEYLCALEIREKLAKVYAETYLPRLANCHNNVGAFYDRSKKYDLAQTQYSAAKEIQEKLAIAQPGAYLPDLARTCNNLGGLYYVTGQTSEAEDEYRLAREIREKLAIQNPGGYSGVTGDTCWNMGVFYVSKKQMKLAKEAFQAARGYYTTAAAYNPRYQKDADDAQRWLERL